MTTRTFRRPAPGALALIYVLLVGLLTAGEAAAAATTAAAAALAAPAQSNATPTQTVIEFYRQLRQKHFREAFALSIYKPAIEGLSAEEFADLQSDFEKMATGVPENVQISGEQISGDTATVFVKVNNDDAAARQQDDSVMLMRKGNGWIIGDKENEAIVKRSGKDFFFTARIQTHHSEVQSMLQRISVAQLVYSQQHNGMFGDLRALINAGLIPKDLESTESTGYRFHVTVSSDAKSFTAGAEPARYNRTGRLSFFLDKTGVRSADNGGKPLSPATK
ncbi:MAG TPA: hypothetical protein VIW80_00935 [Pyrinomonadaceae bacterium]|jgi:hypothetical protein